MQRAPPEKKQTVVEHWPLRLCLKVDNKGAQLKFIVVGDILFNQYHGCSQRSRMSDSLLFKKIIIDI